VVGSFSVRLRRWAGGRAATAASSCARSLTVTVSPAGSAKIGSMFETSMLTECIDANYFKEEVCSYIDSDVGSDVAVSGEANPHIIWVAGAAHSLGR